MTVKFGDVVSNINENVRDPKAAKIDRVIGLDNLDPGEFRINRWGTVTPETTFTRRVRPGQTLFGKRRSYQRKTAYAEFEALCSGDILVFEAKAGLLLPELLPFVAMTDAFYAHALGTSAGSLSPRTRWSDMAKHEFLLPPLDEQRRIADLLWATEAHRISVSAVTAAIVEVEQSILGEVEAGSRSVAAVLAWAKAGGTPSRAHPEYFGGTVPWLKSGEVLGDNISATEEKITDEGLSKSAASLIPAGATVVAMYGETRGQVGRLASAMTTNQAVLGLVAEPERCDPVFLYLWMRSRQAAMRAKSAGGAQKNLNKELVLGEPFPDLGLDEQIQLTARIRQLDHALALSRKESLALQAMRQELLGDTLGRGAEK